MQTGRASRTAEAAAILRAMHRHIDDAPPIFDDAAVESLLPTYARRFLARLDALPQSWRRVYRQRRGGLAQMRAQIVVRARYAEDALQRASRRGVGQYLILAAGLDTFALRDTLPRDAGIRSRPPGDATMETRETPQRFPEHLEFVPVDFERESLNQALGASTFASATPAFISWLGTTYYLRERALRDTLTVLSGLCAAGSELVLDYWSRATLTDAGAAGATCRYARRDRAAGRADALVDRTRRDGRARQRVRLARPRTLRRVDRKCALPRRPRRWSRGAGVLVFDASGDLRNFCALDARVGSPFAPFTRRCQARAMRPPRRHKTTV